MRYGLLFAALVNLMFIFVDNFYLFLTLRTLLGISLSVTISINSIIKKIYAKEEVINIFSYLNSLIGLGLVIAPLIGIQIATYLNYNFVFVFQGGYCFLCYYCSKYILDNNVLNTRSNSDFNIKVVINLLKNKDLIYVSAIRTLSYLPHFLFVSFSSIFLLTVLKLSTNIYSLIMSILGLSCILGGYLSSIINEKIGAISTIILGFILINLGTFLFMLINNTVWFEKEIFIVILICLYLFLISIGRSLLTPFCSKVLIEKCSDAVSSASSLSMIYMYSFCSFTASLLSQTHDLKPTLGYSSLAFGAILIIIVLKYIYSLSKFSRGVSAEFRI